ncbi:hypothetical protein DC366_12710 [Pelagivirga sediminicola]|uniref:TRAP transporter small permease protein n=1 Tax=Pelagivirga sediminicola TaxID=2170575 RepID=A0A2T7G566_9RHOB|nr:TRAP transporter small permease [Pelagivirga sediminicola]PVA09555.1 hypothetical protein DC366_12710 [Pelagivirga sediminicola]
MRRFINRVHDGALALAAAFFAAIAVLVLVQIAGRLIDRAARALDMAPPGLTIPSLAEIGGFLFISAVFLGMAGTLRAGGHVRVTLLIGAMPPGPARWLGALVAAGGTALAAFATWSSLLQTWDSYAFGTVSFGMVKVPLWWPQGAMTLGLGLLALALVQATWQLIMGHQPDFDLAETEMAETGREEPR